MNFHRTRETDSWRVQTKSCVHQDQGERSSDPTRDWVRLAWECLGVSGRVLGWQWLPWGWGTDYSSPGISPLQGHHCPYHSLASDHYREGTQPHPSTENWIQDLLNMAPPIRARPIFPHSQSLPSGSFHSLLSLSIRGQTEWKPQLKKTNQTDHLDYSLV